MLPVNWLSMLWSGLIPEMRLASIVSLSRSGDVECLRSTTDSEIMAGR